MRGLRLQETRRARELRQRHSDAESNAEVYENIDGVLETILAALERRSPL
jgi:very-short-patch-repair endonuclease